MSHLGKPNQTKSIFNLTSLIRIAANAKAARDVWRAPTIKHSRADISPEQNKNTLVLLQQKMRAVKQQYHASPALLYPVSYKYTTVSSWIPTYIIGETEGKQANSSSSGRSGIIEEKVRSSKYKIINVMAILSDFARLFDAAVVSRKLRSKND